MQVVDGRYTLRLPTRDFDTCRIRRKLFFTSARQACSTDRRSLRRADDWASVSTRVAYDNHRLHFSGGLLPRALALASRKRRMTIKQLVLAAIVIAIVAGVALAPLPLHDRTRIANSIVIVRSPEAVFAYVTTPVNWPKWHPASLAVSGATDHSLVAGEQVTEDFIVAGRKGRVVWTALKRDAPCEWIIEGDVDGDRRA